MCLLPCCSVPEIGTAYERIYPRIPSANGPQRWSDTGSDFVSTRDSFTTEESAEGCVLAAEGCKLAAEGRVLHFRADWRTCTWQN